MKYLLGALCAILFAALLVVGCGKNDDDDDDSGTTKVFSGTFARWLYQLQNFDPAAAADTEFNFVVTDYSSDGTAAGEWSVEDIALIQDTSKVALAYLSIGEAEDYRFYWQNSWASNPPDWLGPENPEWPGNYRVRYWMEGWQDIVYDYLDRIAAEGFDGAYLDIVDAYEYWYSENHDARQNMIDFVMDLAHEMHEFHPGFMIFAQNAVMLLGDEDYRAAIDGVGKEDTWYMDNTPRDQDDIDSDIAYMKLALIAGKVVLVIDYCTEQDLIEDFYKKAREIKLIPYASTRELDQLIIHPGLDD